MPSDNRWLPCVVCGLPSTACDLTQEPYRYYCAAHDPIQFALRCASGEIPLLGEVNASVPGSRQGETIPPAERQKRRGHKRGKRAGIDHSVPQDRTFTEAVEGREWILTAPINVGIVPAEMSVYERVWIAAGFTVKDTYPNTFARVQRTKGETPCLIVPNIEHRIGPHRKNERHALYVMQRAHLFETVFEETCQSGPRAEAVALVDAWDRLGQPSFHTSDRDEHPLTVEGVNLCDAYLAESRRRKERHAA